MESSASSCFALEWYFIGHCRPSPREAALKLGSEQRALPLWSAPATYRSGKFWLDNRKLPRITTALRLGLWCCGAVVWWYRGAVVQRCGDTGVWRYFGAVVVLWCLSTVILRYCGHEMWRYCGAVMVGCGVSVALWCCMFWCGDTVALWCWGEVILCMVLYWCGVVILWWCMWWWWGDIALLWWWGVVILWCPDDGVWWYCDAACDVVVILRRPDDGVWWCSGAVMRGCGYTVVLWFCGDVVLWFSGSVVL